jgi:hypothetical protein
MLFAGISIFIVVARGITRLVSARLNSGTVDPRVAAVKFRLSLVAQLTQSKLLLIF